ncbi:MAG: CHRD domain-containing protein, partial [Acidobacteria bacterium]|nr:CHRD domain-containing protein [Acidobacteriota bacterium]
MKRMLKLFTVMAAFALLPMTAKAQQIYLANLSGAQEVPANNSTGRGVARVTLNSSETQITVNVTYS